MSDEKDWQEWRAKRAEGLSSEHGWLSVVGLEWLSDQAAEASISGFPGRWSRDGKVVTARFTESDDVLRGGEPISGTVELDLSAGDDKSLTHGSVLADVIARGTKAGVRYRDSQSQRRRDFEAVPCFEFDPAWQIPAHFTAEPPRQVSLQTVDPEIQEDGTIVGHVDFELAGQRYSLPAFVDPERPHLNFHDETNGDSTAPWRFVMVEVDQDGDATIDFNFAMNYPFAFLPGGCTCPKPLPEARLNVAITAGERRPEEVQ